MAKAKKITSYDNAIEELQLIVNDLQAEVVSIDSLSDKVKRASELIAFCKNKLRETEDAVNKKA